MTEITYKLIAFSRNVGSNYYANPNHSGYGLVKYEDGVAVAIKTVEVTASSAFGMMNFASSMDEASGYSDGWIPIRTSSNGIIAPEKVYENGQWISTTDEWLSSREYEITILKDANNQDIANADDLFRQIQNNADLIDKSGISYDPIFQNCNTWTDYIDEHILGNIGVLDQFNNNTIFVGENVSFPYPGSEMYLPNFTGVAHAITSYLKDKAALENIEQIEVFLNNNNLSYSDIDIDISMTCTTWNCTVTYQEQEYNFSTPIPVNTVNFIEELKPLYATASTTRSPLVIDLDGDGVETVGTDADVHFDHDGNNFAENSGWVGSDDGILVRDVNNNGTIDNGTELFGNNSVFFTPLSHNIFVA